MPYRSFSLSDKLLLLYESTMKTVSVRVEADHLQRLSRVKPMMAVAELIWNGFDADARTVQVVIESNSLDQPDKIIVRDDGVGMKASSIEVEFAKLGGSWKQLATHTRQEKRALHGQGGQGRFRAFALGSHAKWLSRVSSGRRIFQTTVTGYIGSLGKFEVDDAEEVEGTEPGTEVVISELRGDLKGSLIGDKAREEVSVIFAPYLRQYPDVRLVYDGKEVDTTSVVERENVYPIDDIEIDGRLREVEISVLEWKVPIKRALYLCDENGFALSEQLPNIQASGYEFTAYLKSDYFRELEQTNVLALGEANPSVGDIMEAGKSVLREHFRKRRQEDAAKVVDEWKRDEIYPYSGDPRSEIEKSERQVFDVLAVNVAKYLPDFDDSNATTRRFQFHLLRQTLEQSPESLQLIMSEVLKLPQEAQNDLAEILEHTSLTHIISAAKEVSNRLNFLKGLETLVYGAKKELKERRELHRILIGETWIFGEQFNLSVDDESLTAVLRKHRQLVGVETDQIDPVTVLDGSRGIVDIMLSRFIPQTDETKREHLVIELKRPSQPIDTGVLSQTEKYALTVQEDERFKDTDTTWVFGPCQTRWTNLHKHVPDRKTNL